MAKYFVYLLLIVNLQSLNANCSELPIELSDSTFPTLKSVETFCFTNLYSNIYGSIKDKKYAIELQNSMQVRKFSLIDEYLIVESFEAHNALNNTLIICSVDFTKITILNFSINGIIYLGEFINDYYMEKCILNHVILWLKKQLPHMVRLGIK